MVALFRAQTVAELGVLAPVGGAEDVDAVQIVAGREPPGQGHVGVADGPLLACGVQGRVLIAGDDPAVEHPDHCLGLVAGVVEEPGVGAHLRSGQSVLLALLVVSVGVDDGVPGRGVQPRVAEVLVARHQAAAVPGVAARHARPGLVVAAAMGAAVVDVHLDAAVVPAGDDVDHAADGIRAVDRRGPVGDDFDALHHGQRDGRDVRDAAEDAAVAGSAAVHQDQCGCTAEPAQVDGGGGTDVCRAVELRAVYLAGGVDVLRQLAQQARQRQLAGGEDGFPIDDDHVARQLGRLSDQTRAGDDHQLDVLLLSLGLSLALVLLAECRLRGEKQAGEGQDRPKRRMLPGLFDAPTMRARSTCFPVRLHTVCGCVSMIVGVLHCSALLCVLVPIPIALVLPWWPWYWPWQ